MYLLAARQSYFLLHLPPKTRFPEYGSLLLIGRFEETNAERESAAVSGEDRCVTTLITAAKETSSTCIWIFLNPQLFLSRFKNFPVLMRSVFKSTSPVHMYLMVSGFTLVPKPPCTKMSSEHAP